jgi:asparagine synthase (glutamine-hydrolysing)
MFPELLWTGKWRTFYKELQATANVMNGSMRSLFKRQVLSALIPESIKKVKGRITNSPMLLEAANPTLNSAFVERTNLRNRYQSQFEKESTLIPRARERQRNALTAGKIASGFELKDLLCAPFQVEPRFPFADKRLIEFTTAIPATQQLANGWTRSILRRSLDDLLPDKILWRPWKTLMNEAFWKTVESEKQTIQTNIQKPEQLTQYIDIDSLKKSHERFAENKNSRDARALWRAVSLSAWLGEYRFTS